LTHHSAALCDSKQGLYKSILGRDVDVVNHESGSTAAVREVGKTEHGHGEIAKFTADESDASNENGRHSRC